MADYIVHKAVELDALSVKVKSLMPMKRWVLSPKYDGCHAIFLFQDGQFLGCRSRTNEHVWSMDHVGADLLKTYSVLAAGQWAVCGEAWVPGLEFSTIGGMFRRHSTQPELFFVPFDYVPWRIDQAEDGRPVLGEYQPGVGQLTQYYHRISYLADRMQTAALSIVPPSFIVVPGDQDAIKRATADAQGFKKQGGFDGCVLADYEGLYRVGAGKGGEFIKVKPLLSYTLKCVGIERAKGDKTGKNTCALVLDFDGKVQKVATGMTQDQIDDPDQFLYNMIEVEAMGLTVNGLLREPRFKGIRTDV